MKEGAGAFAVGAASLSRSRYGRIAERDAYFAAAYLDAFIWICY